MNLTKARVIPTSYRPNRFFNRVKQLVLGDDTTPATSLGHNVDDPPKSG
jgi:hypothetical protein